jgi:hypothetical protein
LPGEEESERPEVCVWGVQGASLINVLGMVLEETDDIWGRFTWAVTGYKVVGLR